MDLEKSSYLVGPPVFKACFQLKEVSIAEANTRYRVGMV